MTRIGWSQVLPELLVPPVTGGLEPPLGVGGGAPRPPTSERMNVKSRAAFQVNRALRGGVTFESTVGGGGDSRGRQSPENETILHVPRPLLQSLPRATLARRLPSFLPAPSLRPRRPPRGQRSLWEGASALSDSKWLSLFVFSLVCFLLGSRAEACGDHT